MAEESSGGVARQCRTCSYTFEGRDDQTLHYKLDWHMYNVKQSLRGGPSLSEQEFSEQCEGDLSSLSGSGESEEEDEEEPIISRYLEETDELSTAVVCSPHIIFHYNGNCYKALYSLFFPSQTALTDAHLAETVSDTTSTDPVSHSLHFNSRIAVLLYSAQHFAGAIYEAGGSMLLHKTFHRYTVRAKQGTLQGVRDGKGNAPKSFGASLRRHNQIAMFADVEQLLLTWSEALASCHVILHRTAVHNRQVFSMLKEKLPHSKQLIRTIPFSTYRPTLKETRRVFELATKITKTFDSEMERERDARKETREDFEERVVREVQQVNPRSIPNSHLKKRAERNLGDTPSSPPSCATGQDPQEDGVETDIPSPYSDLISLIHSNNINDFTLHSSELVLDLPLPPDNSTLLHHAARSSNPQFVVYLLNQAANPELQNTANKTPYEVAGSKEVRDEFRRFWSRNPEKWDYKSAKIPSPLTAAMEEDQARRKQEKRKAQRAAKSKREKERRAVEEEKRRREEEQLVAEARELRLRTLTPRERCRLAAEGRLAAQTRGHVTGSCEQCGTGLDGLVPFEKETWKFCSVNCVREHRLAGH